MPPAAELDRTILATIAAWRGGRAPLDEQSFNALACALAVYQLRENAAYRTYAATFGVTPADPPRDWRSIPAVPASAFKDATLATCEPDAAELEFRTSGTTRERSGRHFIANAALYEASLAAGFEAAMLADGARLRYVNLVPDPRERPHSSLGYMMAAVGRVFGTETTWRVRGDLLDPDGLRRDLERAVAANAPVCIAATAFALAAATAEFDRAQKRIVLPAGSRIMETGGFKGRAVAIEPDELYERTASAFGLPRAAIVAEYGMTELCSQYYDSAATRGRARRAKIAPPWLRTLVVDADGREVAPGTLGTLRHIDLANRSSVIAIDTEDLGAMTDEGLILLGREAGAELRGCSLDAESLVAAR